MNKTININLGGLFFHIDEKAYQKLKIYIDAIRRSLSDDPKGRDEIISDIELRISELLSEKITDPRQVVSEEDIDEIVTIMGQPEDYMVDEDLFTDEENVRRKLGAKKRLFRDSEDKFLGGVSSGLAYYFDIDVIWIRIIWLVSVFAGFGTGILIYIVLWILLPEAKTTTEKLQMEGEEVTISNIEKRVRSGFNDAADNIRAAADNVSNSLKKNNKSNSARTGIQEIIDVIGKILTTILSVFGKFIGILLVITSVATLFGLIVFALTAGTVDMFNADWFFKDDFVFTNVTVAPFWVIALLMLILIGIPFLMLFFLGLSIISSKSRIISRNTKFAMLGIWLLALFSSIFIGVRQGAEFAREGSVIKRKEANEITSDTLSVAMLNNEIYASDYEDFASNSGYRKIIDEENNSKLYSNNVRFYIRKTDEVQPYLKIKKEAYGRSRLIAKENAEKIDYMYSQEENKFNLNGYFLLDDDESFRKQEVRVTLYLPENKVVYLDESTKNFLGRTTTINNMYRRNMATHYFKMTDAGLECLDCKEEVDESEWQYEEKVNDDEDSDEKKGVKVNIDENGLEINVKDNEGDKAQVTIDENGLHITDEN